MTKEPKLNGELLFILLERDLAAPEAILYWVRERIRLGLNVLGDEQTREATNLAHTMIASQGAAMKSNLAARAAGRNPNEQI